MQDRSANAMIDRVEEVFQSAIALTNNRDGLKVFIS